MLDFTRINDSEWNTILDKMSDPPNVFEGTYNNGSEFANLGNVSYVDSAFHQPTTFATNDFAAESGTTVPIFPQSHRSNDRHIALPLVEIDQVKKEVESQKKRCAMNRSPWIYSTDSNSLDAKCLQLDALQKDLRNLHDYVQRLQPILEEIKQMAEGGTDRGDEPSGETDQEQ